MVYRKDGWGGARGSWGRMSSRVLPSWTAPTHPPPPHTPHQALRLRPADAFTAEMTTRLPPSPNPHHNNRRWACVPKTLSPLKCWLKRWRRAALHSSTSCRCRRRRYRRACLLEGRCGIVGSSAEFEHELQARLLEVAVCWQPPGARPLAGQHCPAYIGCSRCC